MERGEKEDRRGKMEATTLYPAPLPFEMEARH
jgi:hypothetical protein